MQNIGIIGAGAWGTALAQAMAAAGNKVTIWAREPDIIDSINTRHENESYLKGVTLDPAIAASGDLAAVTAASDTVLMVTPAQFLRTTLEQMKPHLREGTPVVICAKGIEIQSGMLLSQIAAEIVSGAKIAILTGPTFAAEIARGLPSAVTLAMKDKEQAELLAETLSSRILRMYASDDIIGTQIGGAVKNVIAIACGIIEGKKLGESARAALVTRGVAEMARLAAALGAKRETLMGMCGVGDLILTCSSMQSRNFSLGVALGQGRKLDEILKERNSVTEGIYTAKALVVMAKNNAVDMPISDAVDKCLSDGASVDDMIERIMDRPLKVEAA